MKVYNEQIRELESSKSHVSSSGNVINQFIKEEDLEIDETEDEANNIIKNKMRRLNGTKKLKSRQISIDNDNLDDDPLIYDNAQDADNRSISHLGASLRTKKRRDRA